MLEVKELPDEFRLAANDDALAPRLKDGQIAYFERGLTAKPGDVVLLKDAAGAMHMRVMRQKAAGRWEAHATNDAYTTLDSERDGLTILAVLTGMVGRWSA